MGNIFRQSISPKFGKESRPSFFLRKVAHPNVGCNASQPRSTVRLRTKTQDAVHGTVSAIASDVEAGLPIGGCNAAPPPPSGAYAVEVESLHY